MTPKQIGFIGFDGVVALDLIGPVEAFDSVKIHEGKGQSRRGYDVVIIGLTRRPFVAESGVIFQPQRTLQNAPLLDTLVVPGGRDCKTLTLRKWCRHL